MRLSEVRIRGIRTRRRQPTTVQATDKNERNAKEQGSCARRLRSETAVKGAGTPPFAVVGRNWIGVGWQTQFCIDLERVFTYWSYTVPSLCYSMSPLDSLYVFLNIEFKRYSITEGCSRAVAWTCRRCGNDPRRQVQLDRLRDQTSGDELRAHQSIDCTVHNSAPLCVQMPLLGLDATVVISLRTSPRAAQTLGAPGISGRTTRTVLSSSGALAVQFQLDAAHGIGTVRVSTLRRWRVA